MPKTITEINEKIKKGEAVVLTAEEIIEFSEKHGFEKTARQVDVVTTGTFGPMCSSSAYFNLGHSSPRIKLGGGTATLNDVPVYTGLAAVDILIGATACAGPAGGDETAKFEYGGGHVISELAAGKSVRLRAEACGTDCYPRRSIDTLISLGTVNEAVLFNPRNCYQNYNVAVNLSDRTLYTYMGTLRPGMANANYCSAGQLSPLLKDPLYKTIGIGTRVFLGGGVGYVAWPGTQFNASAPRGENGVPRRPAGTLAVIGDLKGMSPRFLSGVAFRGYGTSLAVGIGVPIPILSEDILRNALVRDSEIFAPVVDYSSSYPNRKADVIAEVSYAELRSGSISIGGRRIPTAPLSNIVRAREIAAALKEWIAGGRFLLTDPVAALPASGPPLKPLNETAP